MAQIGENSDQGMMVEDHLFYLPATMTERWNYTEQRLGTVTATNDDCPDFTWQITPSDSELISLSDIRLEVDVHLARADGTPLQAEDCVSPINNLLHSLFQSVTIELGGRSISDTSNLYFLRAYLENVIGFSADAQKSQLTSAGFFLDSNFSTPYNGVVAQPAAAGGRAKITFNSNGAQQRHEMINLISPL